MSERWKIISTNEIPSEIRRLKSLTKMERKLDVTCNPLVINNNDLQWIYVETLTDDDQIDCKFSTSYKEYHLVLILTKNIWEWNIFKNGTALISNGENHNVDIALDECYSSLMLQVG